MYVTVIQNGPKEVTPMQLFAYNLELL